MKQRRIEEEDLGPMKLIFNYENVFYSFFYDDISGCIHRSREYAMNYVYSGEMILDNGKQQIHVGKGDRKSTRLNSSHITPSRMPSSA